MHWEATSHGLLVNSKSSRRSLHSIIGTLRSTTATLMKTSPQNITLHYRKFLAVRSSRSRRTMWVKCPRNKLARAVWE